MNGFTLLWQKILDSSIWMESKETRLVWITLLAMKDSDGIVRAPMCGIAYRARVTEQECETAMNIFLNPDPRSSTADDDGRRVRKVDCGWEVINHDKYRFSTEAKRQFWREEKAKQRERIAHKKHHKGKGGPLPYERAAVKAMDNGNHQLSDQLAATRAHEEA